MIDDVLTDYERQLLELFAQIEAGEVARREGRRRLSDLVAAFLLLAYLAGGGSQQDDAGMAALNGIVARHRGSVRRIVDDLRAGRYTAAAVEARTGLEGAAAAQKAAESLKARVDLWVNSARGAATVGTIHNRQPERRYTWKLGATEQHCADCLRLHNVTLTAGEWRRLRSGGLYPQSPDLECGGWHCDCSLVEEPEERPLTDFEQAIERLGVTVG